jgi:hypothetical protein
VQSELSYYEYWLSKKSWPAWRAINLVIYYLKLRRSWEPYEIYEDVSDTLYNQIAQRLSSGETRGIFTNYIYSHDIDGAGNWIPREIDLNESEVAPAKFIEWAHACGYPLPYEFMVFIGVEETVERPNKKLQDRIDREVIQGIARTLWDEDPKMTIEQMQDHKAIQIYGSGKVCCADGTLRRWIGEVDPRTAKRGRKKKSGSSE